MKAVPFPQLQTFLAVARHRSFSGAARELSVSRSAASQTVRQLEEQLGVVLFARTTRSVALTEAGQRLVDGAEPGLLQIVSTFEALSAAPGEVSGRVRLSVPQAALSMVIEPLLPLIRERHPHVEIEIKVEDRFVDIVAEGFDAGVRISESIQRDMVQVRLTKPFRFVVVGSPAYLARRGTPKRPEDLLEHECITFRSPTTDALYAWELERGRRTWRVAVRGGIVTGDPLLHASLAARGVGLVYAFEPLVAEAIHEGRLVRVLEEYAPTVPGYFLYYPSRAQRSPPMQVFVEAIKELVRLPR
jgi:DNA-binding transcriptional LysR family regulator